MYTKKQIIHKVLLGTVLLIVAIFVTVFIRENMNVQSPESALPTIKVTVNETTTFATESVFRAGYEWNFFTTTAKHTPPYSVSDLKQVTPPVQVIPNSSLVLEFSIKPKKITVSRADGKDADTFMDLVGDGQEPIITAAVPGEYMYRVQADFGWRGSIVYFFRVQVV